MDASDIERLKELVGENDDHRSFTTALGAYRSLHIAPICNTAVKPQSSLC
jgi:hypothetical protein